MSGDTKSGIETLPDGRKIPFSKLFGPGDYVVTFYGSRDATAHSRGVSLLAKHTRRSTTAWGMAYDSFAMLRGEASRVLQKQWGTTEANELYLAVEWVRRFPEELKNTSTPRTAGSIIQDAILRAIKAGNPGSLDLLARCIVAVDKNFSENIEDYFSGRKATTLQKVALAIGNAAHRLGRIPTWQECLDAFVEVDGDPDQGNFIRALRRAGFGWILPGATTALSEVVTFIH